MSQPSTPVLVPSDTPIPRMAAVLSAFPPAPSRGARHCSWSPQTSPVPFSPTSPAASPPTLALVPLNVPRIHLGTPVLLAPAPSGAYSPAGAGRALLPAPITGQSVPPGLPAPPSPRRRGWDLPRPRGPTAASASPIRLMGLAPTPGPERGGHGEARERTPHRPLAPVVHRTVEPRTQVGGICADTPWRIALGPCVPLQLLRHPWGGCAAWPRGVPTAEVGARRSRSFHLRRACRRASRGQRRAFDVPLKRHCPSLAGTIEARVGERATRPGLRARRRPWP